MHRHDEVALGQRGPQAWQGRIPQCGFVRFGQCAGGQRGVAAGGWLGAFHDPVAKVHAQRVDGLRVRHGVGGQHAHAKVVARAGRAGFGQGHAGQAGVKTARATAVVAASQVVALDVGGQWQVLLGVGAHPLGRELERPDFGRAKVFHHLGASLRGRAPVQNASRRQAAHRVGMRQPPLWTFAAGLVELEHAVGLGPAEVQRNAAPSNDGPQAVVHAGARFVPVKAQVQPAAQIVARLRHAPANAVLDGFGQRVGGACVVSHSVLEERAHIAPRGKAHAQHIGVGGGEHHLVEALGVKTVFQAYLRSVRHAGERVLRITACPGPVAGRNGLLADHLTGHGLAGAGGQLGLGRVQAQRFVGHRVGLHHQGLRGGASPVDDAREHLARHARAVGVARHRHLKKLHARHRSLGPHGGGAGVVALPGTGQVDIPEGALLRRKGRQPAAVGHVVPHQSAGLLQIDGLVDQERGDVAHLAVGVFGQFNVLNDGVTGQLGVEFAKGAACNLLVGDAVGAAGHGRHGQGFVDDDAAHAGLHGEAQAEQAAGQQPACFGGGHGMAFKR